MNNIDNRKFLISWALHESGNTAQNAERTLRAALATRDWRIRTAHYMGLSLREIADSVPGVSYERVRQILAAGDAENDSGADRGKDQ